MSVWKGGPVHDHVHYWDPRVPTDSELDARSIERLYPRLVLDGKPALFTRARDGDSCPSCKDGRIRLQQAVEIGHTFHLGRRYSVPLEAYVLDENNRNVPMEMGCHGIGVSRLIGAAAALLATEKGLNWPKAISPFETVIVPASKTSTSDAENLYDQLNSSGAPGDGEDVLIDDRERPLGWKLNDADLIGYPFIVVMGNAWQQRQRVELQCHRVGLKEEISVDQLAARIQQVGKEL